MVQCNDSMIEELKIYNPNGKNNLFSESIKYIIPLYQRAFAWEDEEINQLIEDIEGINESNDTSYYLGSLIVSQSDTGYEVIDGQQRLTTLFLVLKKLLGWEKCDYLTFAHRPISDKTLNAVGTNENSLDESDDGIIHGWNIIEEYFKNNDTESFKKKLSKVKIYRIKVPPHTDLNRYFEIMNTRGEQLEQQDILKAHLMDCLNPNERNTFALIWDACVNMNGYVQMHFTPNNRALIFGDSWTDIPRNINSRAIKSTKNDIVEDNILGIIKDAEQSYLQNKLTEFHDEDDDGSQRFKSIIEAPYFLLHVLKVFLQKERIPTDDTNRLLDDKKLFETFQDVIKKYKDKHDFSMKFIKCLLICRYLFDTYIIKRETSNTDEDGIWSLKCLCSSGQQSKKKAYYKNTKFANEREWEKTYEERHEQILMLQACLRVSYTSPKVMHWITELLSWLYKNLSNNLVETDYFLEKWIANAVNENYLKKADFNMGVDTQHIVFNYLDYLLWNAAKKDKKKEYDDFTFEYRNSVEHWYPQHPSEGTFDSWSHEEGLDYFGNLCLIQRKVNSKFSNLSPMSKKESFEDTISKGSIKLRKMAELTKNNNKWKEGDFKVHGEEMLEILTDRITELL